MLNGHTFRSQTADGLGGAVQESDKPCPAQKSLGNGRARRFSVGYLGHRRPRHGRGHHPPVLLAGVRLGGGGRPVARHPGPAARRRGAGRSGEGDRRLPVPDRHDAALGAGPAAGPVRLARRPRRAPGERLRHTAVHAGLRGGHGRDHVPVQRCDRGGADARRRRRRPRGRGEGAAALSPHLRLHRQRGELRAADLQSGQPGHLRQPHAAADAVAAALRAFRRRSPSSRPMARCGSRSGSG